MISIVALAPINTLLSKSPYVYLFQVISTVARRAVKAATPNTGIQLDTEAKKSTNST